jgi:hypothetical protein
VSLPEIDRQLAHPEKPFPGVPLWRMDIAPVGLNAPKLTPDARQFLVHLTQKANGFFDGIARNMVPEEGGEYFTIHSTKETAMQLVHKTAETVYYVTRDIPNAHLVFFPAGAIPIATILQDKGYPAERMHALDISGSQGTESGSATVNGIIARKLLNPAHNIIIPEDIIDSVITIFKLIHARAAARDNSPKHIAWLRALGERLRAAHTNGNNDPAVYADFARAAAVEHVSILSVWSKNEQARKALINQACCLTPKNSWIQKELFECYPITPLPPKLWVLGGDYVMDTGVLWSRIVPNLDIRLHTDPRVTQYMNKTADGKTHEWLLRAARIGSLAKFDTEGRQKTNVINHIARLATQMLDT